VGPYQRAYQVVAPSDLHAQIMPRSVNLARPCASNKTQADTAGCRSSRNHLLGLSDREVTGRTGFSQAKVSRFVARKTMPSVAEIERWASGGGEFGAEGRARSVDRSHSKRDLDAIDQDTHDLTLQIKYI
jgi:hypothetical protein